MFDFDCDPDRLLIICKLSDFVEGILEFYSYEEIENWLSNFTIKGESLTDLEVWRIILTAMIHNRIKSKESA